MSDMIDAPAFWDMMGGPVECSISTLETMKSLVSISAWAFLKTEAGQTLTTEACTLASNAIGPVVSQLKDWVLKVHNEAEKWDCLRNVGSISRRKISCLHLSQKGPQPAPLSPREAEMTEKSISDSQKRFNSLQERITLSINTEETLREPSRESLTAFEITGNLKKKLRLKKLWNKLQQIVNHYVVKPEDFGLTEVDSFD